jgi:hypothetical protein
MQHAAKVANRTKLAREIAAYLGAGLSIWGTAGGPALTGLLGAATTHLGVPYGIPAVGAALIAGKSRSFEEQADEYGLRYLTAAGYDPLGLSQMFQAVKAASDHPGFNFFKALFRTHPDLESRIGKAESRARAEIAAQPELGQPLPPSEEFLRVKARLPTPERILKRLRLGPSALALSVESTLDRSGAFALNDLIDSDLNINAQFAYPTVVDQFEADLQGRKFGTGIRRGNLERAPSRGFLTDLNGRILWDVEGM